MHSIDRQDSCSFSYLQASAQIMQLPAQLIFCKIIYCLLFDEVKHSAFKKKVEFWPQSFICLQFIWNILVRDNFTTIHQNEETEIYALLSWKNEDKTI